MTAAKAKRIFEQYNSQDDVIRCPRGRAAIRKEIHLYARAAVNLYGVISREDFVAIFNAQNSDQTNNEEIYTLLLPLVLKEGRYAFYKEYLVHKGFFHDFDQVDYLLEHQEDKPRYLPEKDEFLNYVEEHYEDNAHWLDVLYFMCDTFGSGRNTFEGYRLVKETMMSDSWFLEMYPILNKYHLIPDSEILQRDFFDILMEAQNNTRNWKHKGHTPYEVHEMLVECNKIVIPFPTRQ